MARRCNSRATLSAWSALLASTWLLLATDPARAEETADGRFDAGVTALEAGHYAEAAEAFERSFALEARPATMCNLALTYDRWSGHAHEATEHYLACAKLDDTGQFKDYAIERVRALGARAETPAPERRAPTAEAAPPVLEPAPPVSPTPPESEPLAPTTEPRTASGLLWGGVASGVAAASLFAAGGALAADTRDEERYFEDAYPPGRTIPGGSEDASRLREARRRARTARVLYGLGGITAGLSVALVLSHLLRSRGESATGGPTLSLTPLPGGALLTADL